jgi:hypothetical protein
MRITHIAISLFCLSCVSEKGLTVYNQAPSVTILNPSDDADFEVGSSVIFLARIGDDQDPFADLQWVWRSDRHDLTGVEQSGDDDGQVRMTTDILDLGTHEISLIVTDTKAEQGSASVRVQIGAVVDDTDLDGDGFDSPEDCNDMDSAVYPGAEEYPYDGIDQDCDGEDLTDQDGDGHDAVVAGGEDCDDLDSSIYPGAEEVCDDEDNDCDSIIDEPGATGCYTMWEDTDDDGYGSDVSACVCGPNGEFTADNSDDCLDTDPNVNPGHTDFETLPRADGGWDYNCNGEVEQQYTEVGECDGDLFDCDERVGWEGSAPDCGVEGSWVTGCHPSYCEASLTPVVQGCR